MSSQKEILNHQEHLANLVEQSKHSFKNIKALVDYLINLRDAQHSELIFEKGIEVVTKYSSYIDDTTIYLVEEFFYAALDIKSLDWSSFFVQIISKRYPQSVKSMRMLAMFHEAIQDHEKAKLIYGELLQTNPGDFQTLKRLISYERDRGDITEAINLLNKYLEINQQDAEAWNELTDIYLSKQNYEKAQFCYEEILTMQPENYMVNIKYAEMLYSLGNTGDNLESLLLARKYFSHALALQDEGKQYVVRALWGLLQTCKMIEGQMKREDEKNKEIIKTCQQKLKEIYSSQAKSIDVSNMKIMN